MLLLIESLSGDSVMVVVVVWLVVDFLCARLGGSMTKCGREPD